VVTPLLAVLVVLATAFVAFGAVKLGAGAVRRLRERSTVEDV